MSNDSPSDWPGEIELSINDLTDKKVAVGVSIGPAGLSCVEFEDGSEIWLPADQFRQAFGSDIGQAFTRGDTDG